MLRRVHPSPDSDSLIHLLRLSDTENGFRIKWISFPLLASGLLNKSDLHFLCVARVLCPVALAWKYDTDWWRESQVVNQAKAFLRNLARPDVNLNDTQNSSSFLRIKTTRQLWVIECTNTVYEDVPNATAGGTRSNHNYMFEFLQLRELTLSVRQSLINGWVAVRSISCIARSLTHFV